MARTIPRLGGRPRAACYVERVNFFGHAVVACWERDDPGFVLGAMLPDFGSMCRGRVRDVADPNVAAGVAHHHRTDRAFHDTHEFRSLCAWSGETLRALGMRRPSSLAVAHVGVELLLDGTLVGEPGVRNAYVRALEAADADALGGAITWHAEDHAERFSRLRDRLLARGVPDDYREPDAVAERLTWALQRRPRLALIDGEEHITRTWAEQAHPRVTAASPTLITELRTAMTDTEP